MWILLRSSGLRFAGADLLSCDSLWSDRLGTLGAQLNETEQDLVALRLQLLDRARSDLGMNAVDELLLHLGRQHRVAQRLPPGCHRTGKLLQEMLNAAGAAAEVIEHHTAHDAPAQARPPGEGGVDVRGADDVLGNEVIDFAHQGTLQAVGDVAGHLLLDPYRPLSD